MGQDDAVRLARLAAKQRRHLLLVAPPGTGKSMIAQAMASLLPKPTEEIAVLHNPENPERPFCEVRTLAQLAAEKNAAQKLKSKLVEPSVVPSFVAERLGFRCRHCGALSKASERECGNCGSDKYAPLGSDVLGPSAFLGVPQEQQLQKRVHTTRLREDGEEEVIVYERDDATQKIRVLDQKTLEKLEALQRHKMRRVIVPFNRKTFVAASGASETELLGDVRHDPFGGHVAASGTLPYQRVVAGAVHEAHQGVLFIDEVGALAGVQRFLLTAMQEKTYPIVGRNPQSAGASVRVDGVPCDFVLVAATNINDLPAILPALRSRITGNGYEILLNVSMSDNDANREKIARFAAQEIRKDGRIPHASRAAIDVLIEEAKKKAKQLDNQDGALTLRFRELSGVIRLAGDLAKDEGSPLIEAQHVEQAVRRGKSIEEQLREKYGSVFSGAASEFRVASPRGEQKEIS
ncbi:MAG: ATP-binding protein [Candidatus Norongarragalinales archaeon]